MAVYLLISTWTITSGNGGDDPERVVPRSRQNLSLNLSILSTLLFPSKSYQPNITAKMDDSKGLDIAFEEAKQSYSEGGIPV